MSRYWLERQAKQTTKFADASHEQIRKKYISYYKQTLKDVTRLMTNLYNDILDEDGVPSANELYKYNRYYKMREELIQALSSLGSKNIKAMDKKMENVYKYACSQTLSNVTTIENKAIDNLIKEMWNANGKQWSKSIWCRDGLNVLNRTNRNMNKLQQTVEKGLLDCVARGAKKDDLVKTLTERFNVSFSEADRLARTELTHIQNQGTLDSYKKANISKYRFLATLDSRTSEQCRDLDGTTHDVLFAEAGINLPPMHANCRCTTIPVLDDKSKQI